MGWLYIPLIIFAFFLLTRAPELRVQRLKMGISLFFFVGMFALFCVTSNPLLLFLGVVGLRLGAFFFGFAWVDIFTENAVAGVNSVLQGLPDQEAEGSKMTSNVALHWRATGRPKLALNSLRAVLKKQPDDFGALWLMATIQAEDCRDVAAARQTVERILQSADIPFPQKDYAAAQFELWRKRDAATAVSVLPLEPLSRGKGTQTSSDRARQLRLAGRPGEAIVLLEEKLKAKPDDHDLLLTLASICAEDLHDIARAEAYVKKIIALDYTPRGWKEMVVGRLADWRDGAVAPPPRMTATLAGSNPVPVVVGIDAAREHRTAGRRGSAIECLEERLQVEPGDFAALMLMAEIQAEDNSDVRAAEKIVRRILSYPTMTAEQKEQAEQRLKEWKKAARERPGAF